MSARVAEAVDTSAEEAVADIRDASPAVTARKDPVDMPLPTEPRTIFLGGLFGLGVLAALYVASPIVLPVVLAIVLKLLLQPLVRLLDRTGLPHALGAIVAIFLLVMTLGGVISGVAGPAASWAGKLPDAIPQIQKELAFLARPISSLEWMMAQLQDVAGMGMGASAASSAHSINVLGALFSGTTSFAVGLFTTLVVLFFLLVSGETFMRRFVEILPSFAEKRQAVELAIDIERNISAYLITVSVINFVVGLLTFAVMWACGVANPLLWGVTAFVMNFLPILGPMFAIVVFLLASVLSLGVTLWALLPVGLYFLIHVLEGEIVTPMLLARRFTINPVAVILALLFWYWM
ncbi:MAG TPA: AI-2E family transporter, partial [Acetobacteraceae bacterium]|nr:AI-2E family transporter [Acetobacteraceae bacterium]